MRKAVALLGQRRLLGWVRRSSRPLVPGRGLPFGHQHGAPVEGPETKLDVLGTPLAERVIAPTHLVKEPSTHPQVAARGHPKPVGVGRSEITGPGHVEINPPGAGDPPASHRPGRAARGPNAIGRDPLEVGVVAKPNSQHLVVDVVPASMGLHQLGLGDHVAVQKHQDLPGRPVGAQIAGPGQAKPVALLGYHRGGKTHTAWQGDWRIRAVVHYNGLHQVCRVGLVSQAGERQLQFGLAHVAGQDHGDSRRGAPAAELPGIE